MDFSVFHRQISPLQKVETAWTKATKVELFIKRDDLLDPLISGNKWRKLKYNLFELQQSGKKGIVTFGGAFSNHLHAVAAAGQRFGFETVGIVRGERASNPSPTILACEKMGMRLHFVGREQYREKENDPMLAQLLSQYPEYMLLPEGGANELALKGCAEIMDEIETEFDYLCVACGTGATLAGIAQKLPPPTKLLGFPVLKGAEKSILEMANKSNFEPSTLNLELKSDYHFGGYAKHNDILLTFIQAFESETGVLLEQVYTGKLLFGICDLASKGYFPSGSMIVALHTGGLQGRLPSLTQ
jgi:1-aminocyclopropane-1-carboxylate deaminase